MPKVKVPTIKDGKLEMKEGELMNIVRQEEPWSEYVLEDGTIIRTKQTALQIVKMDEAGIDGKTAYSMQTQPSTVIIPKI